MNEPKNRSEILVKATAQGFSITIHGKKQEDGSWKCSVEKNEVVLTDIPANEHATSLGEQRHYDKTEFELSFEEALREFDDAEWFLCHPGGLHPDVADIVIAAFDKRMAEYDRQYPVDSPLEQFIRENKAKEWKNLAANVQSDTC